MGIKDILQKLRGNGNSNSQAINSMADQIRMERIAHERQLSPNERELNRLRTEDREEMIKEELDFARKKRDDDIARGHNPLDVKNITSHTEWEVLKEKNLFANRGNILQGTESIMKNDPNLLKTNHKLLKGGNMLKI